MTDVRRYPAAIQQLTAPIAMSMSPLASTAQGAYGNADVVRWRGPYLTKDSIGAVSTGYGWTFKPNFEIDSLAPTGVASVAAGQRYMMVKVIMPVKDSMSALSLDSQFDDGNLQTGSIRYRTAAAADTLKFLLLPIS